MHTVDIPLNNYQYRFRKLSFEEEFALDVKPGDDGIKAALAAALIAVSGLTLRTEDAQTVIHSLPDPVRNRLWVLYKAGLPEDRFFTTRGLYSAPEPAALASRIHRGEQEQDTVAGRAVAELERRFKEHEAAQAKEIEQRVFEDAKRRGVLTRATVPGVVNA